MGIGDDTTAARRLRLLQAEFTQPTRRRDPGARPAPSITPTAPLNLGIVDYIGTAVDEVVQHTRAAAPDAGPLPAEASSIYGWMREHTAHLDQERQDAREQVIYRQSLEHAILMGDYKVVRPHRCPECECLGLLWDTVRRRAVCTNLNCVDKDGLGHAWTLKRLAYEHVTSKRILKTRAT